MPLAILDVRGIKNDPGFSLGSHSCAYMGLSFWNEIFTKPFSPRDQVVSSDLRIFNSSATQWIPEQYVQSLSSIPEHFEFSDIYWELAQYVFPW